MGKSKNENTIIVTFISKEECEITINNKSEVKHIEEVLEIFKAWANYKILEEWNSKWKTD